MVLCNKMSINAFILLASHDLLDLAGDSIDIFSNQTQLLIIITMTFNNQ
jgi:hypothetical protein